VEFFLQHLTKKKKRVPHIAKEIIKALWTSMMDPLVEDNGHM
jgi:hypothetical protein